MEASPDYDPDPDLALLRGDSSLRLANTALIAAGIFVLGTYLQSVAFVMPTAFRLWLHGKLVILIVLAFTVLRTSKLRPESRVLFPAVALTTFAESTTWVVALFRAAYAFSCFAYLIVPASLIALVCSPLVLRAVGRAESARERLAANGIDDPFA